MNKLFRPKTMRRMAVFMALVAPIIYLFGSLFFALNGAHGTQVFASDGSGDSVDVSMSRGLSISINDGSFMTGYSNDYAHDGYYHFDTGVSLEYETSASSGFNVRVFYYDEDYSFISYNQYEAPSLISVSSTIGYYFAIFSYNPSAFSITLSGFSIVSSDYLSAAEYSSYIFGNFFDKDNFLVQWGSDAISENPHGFAPFGYFWRYLDSNVLHLSNEQVGLMAYGYMYYAAHVLLFDVGFILVTFFLTFIQKVADKIGGEDHA